MNAGNAAALAINLSADISAGPFANSEAINANLPARRSAEREGGKGLGYGL